MILRQLLERLMAFGVVCVMTSKYVKSIIDELTTSRHPDELYINGIQRESFLPAIQLIKDRFEVVDLNSPTGQSLISL
jgi:protein AFG1